MTNLTCNIESEQNEWMGRVALNSTFNEMVKKRHSYKDLWNLDVWSAGSFQQRERRFE